MRKFEDLLLRWSLGAQNTVTLSDFNDKKKYMEYVSFTKLSILSFQKWFSGAKFIVLYNGRNFSEFLPWFNECNPQLLEEVEFINQFELVPEKIPNPYNFFPHGVWWKWVPWRIDINKHEIGVDTDIVCINEPLSWYKWLDSEDELILVAPERFDRTKVNTCGDFHNHPLLQDKKPANCGVVGQKSGYDFGERFFSITNEVRCGYTQDSLFVTEQGAINLWIYSLEMEGVKHRILDFKTNAWMRDFLYFLGHDIVVETVHAVSWHKEVLKKMSDLFEKKIRDQTYNDANFVLDIVARSKKMNESEQRVIAHQLFESCSDTEYF